MKIQRCRCNTTNHTKNVNFSYLQSISAIPKNQAVSDLSILKQVIRNTLLHLSSEPLYPA